jgi:hypothetical protein
MLFCRKLELNQYLNLTRNSFYQLNYFDFKFIIIRKSLVPSLSYSSTVGIREGSRTIRYRMVHKSPVSRTGGSKVVKPYGKGRDGYTKVGMERSFASGEN